MLRLSLQESLSSSMILVVLFCVGSVAAQPIEIVTNDGSRFLMAPDDDDLGGNAITVLPSESGRLAPFHVAPRAAEPLREDPTSPVAVAVPPLPMQPLAIAPVDLPLEVGGQHQDFSITPTPPDIGRQIAEALARDEVIRLRVNFDFDSASLRPDSMPMIEPIANALRADLSLLIEVQGHTDNVGSQEYNQDLSVRRAHEVRRILIEQFGIDEWRITSAGYGMSRPADPLDTDEARAANRRVEIHYRAN